MVLNQINILGLVFLLSKINNFFYHIYVLDVDEDRWEHPFIRVSYSELPLSLQQAVLSHRRKRLQPANTRLPLPSLQQYYNQQLYQSY